jgi:quercetin dioxygenase-like cupin family protein
MTKQDLNRRGAREGMVFSVVGDTYRLVTTGAETNGAYALIDMVIPAGGGPGPHSHESFEEAFYVLEGEIEVGSETSFYTARAGDFVRIPKGGIIHQFQNRREASARLLCIAVPAGLESLFQEIGVPVQVGQILPKPTLGLADLRRLSEVAEKHGQKLYPPDYLERFRGRDA